MPAAPATPAKQSVGKGQERHPAAPAPASTGGWGDTQDPPRAEGTPQGSAAPAPHTTAATNHTGTPGSHCRGSQTERGFLPINQALICSSPVPARGVHSTGLCQLPWHSSTVPLFFPLSLVQVGLFMSEKHKWEKGPGEDRVKYHLRVKHHLQVTLRALLNLPGWRD